MQIHLENYEFEKKWFDPLWLGPKSQLGIYSIKIL
jgi:hypothetical protein